MQIRPARRDDPELRRLRDELRRLAGRLSYPTAELLKQAASALDREVAGDASPSTFVAPPAPSPRPAAGQRNGAGARNPLLADKELIDGFIAESLEYLRHAEEALLKLESAGADAEAVNRVFRCFHTIKGTSTFLGFERISEISHRAESLMSRVREGSIELRGNYADLALRSVDILTAMIRSIGKPREPGSGPATGFEELVRALDAAAAGNDACDAPEVEAPAAESEPAEPFVRVRAERLEQLLELVDELAGAHVKLTSASAMDELAAGLAEAGRILQDVQALGRRMVKAPARLLVRRLVRQCRDAARRSGKQVELRTTGAHHELDRGVLDLLSDPLLHMIRNAVDHGIEAPAERRAMGKPESGRIQVSFEPTADGLVVELSDDGRGLDLARIRAKAVECKLLQDGDTYDAETAGRLIFAPGLSTAERVTDLSGRGVGLDVVRRHVELLGGRIEVRSAVGRGTRFRLVVPPRRVQ